MYTFSIGAGQCGQFCTQPDTGLIAAGLDVGYQLTFRHLYVAFVAGFGVGAGTYREWEVVTPFTTTLAGGVLPSNPIAPVVLFNLNFLRLGGWD